MSEISIHPANTAMRSYMLPVHIAYNFYCLDIFISFLHSLLPLYPRGEILMSPAKVKPLLLYADAENKNKTYPLTPMLMNYTFLLHTSSADPYYGIVSSWLISRLTPHD
jgi:hypothetical protein